MEGKRQWREASGAGRPAPTLLHPSPTDQSFKAVSSCGTEISFAGEDSAMKHDNGGGSVCVQYRGYCYYRQPPSPKDCQVTRRGHRTKHVETPLDDEDRSSNQENKDLA